MMFLLAAAGLAVLVAGALARGRARRTGRCPRGVGRRTAVLLVLATTVGLSLAVAPAAAAGPFDCKESPEPDRAGAGLAGALDPALMNHGRPGTPYGDFGYAGQIWQTYDLGCPPANLSQTGNQLASMIGDWTFSAAKDLVATTNFLHYALVQDGPRMFNALDGVMAQVVRAAYSGVFLPFIGLALLISAAIMLWKAHSARLAEMARHIALGIVALAVASVAVANPGLLYKPLDDLLLGGTAQIQAGFVAPGQPTNDVNTLPSALSDQLVYRNWLSGEFGGDAAKAQQLGPQLLSAQAFNKQEVASGQAGQPDRVKAKKDQYANVANQVGPADYPTFQGKNEARLGRGLLALFESLAVCLFQLAAKAVLLAALLLLRLMVVLLPAIAVVAVIRPALLQGVLRMASSAGVHALVASVVAGAHAVIFFALAGSGPLALGSANGDLSPFATVIMLVVSAIAWGIMRPFKRIFSLGHELGRNLGATDGGGGGRGLAVPILGEAVRQVFTSRAARSGARTGAQQGAGMGWWMERGHRPPPDEPPTSPQGWSTPPPPPPPPQPPRPRTPTDPPTPQTGPQGGAGGGAAGGGFGSGGVSGGGTGPRGGGSGPAGSGSDGSGSGGAAPARGERVFNRGDFRARPDLGHTEFRRDENGAPIYKIYRPGSGRANGPNDSSSSQKGGQ